MRLVLGSTAFASLLFATLLHAQSRPAETGEIDWRSAEAPRLENHVQLTFDDRFYKAGEAYFSPDDQRVIFQAVEQPPAGVEPDEFYGMYVADVVRAEGGRITGLENIVRLSPNGSANTCGWFHPTDPGQVLFASTIVAPSPGAPPGYDRRSGRYRWMFPPEMRIVRTEISPGSAGPRTLIEVAGDGTAYCAEGALDATGRHLVYCSLATGGGDLYIMDMKTGTTRSVVAAPGYDGGPFFSPDGKRICFRSDRQGNHLLQLFIGELAFDDDGAVVGLEREFQLTENGHVNWAPYWHPDGRHLVYATSEVGHRNYEVFIVDADPGGPGPTRYGTRRTRLTYAARADVLPTFSQDGRHMIWTSQRGESGRSQLWVAEFTLEAPR
ncbi:MAG: hypothetical protein HKO59_06560 [Phycisphaerales bacterium]|nr:hypothetical protein [Phycisphaerales bacterium]